MRRSGRFAQMDSPFSLVLASGFYDGAEDGLALRANGEAAAFWSLGDSPQRVFRAFYFRPVSDWSAAEGFEKSARDAGKTFVLLGPDSGDGLNRCVATAESVTQIGVGHPYLDWLVFAPATTSDIETILEGGTDTDRYRRAHTHLKHHRVR